MLLSKCSADSLKIGDSLGRTPLHIAAASGAVGVTSLLLDVTTKLSL